MNTFLSLGANAARSACGSYGRRILDAKYYAPAGRTLGIDIDFVLWLEPRHKLCELKPSKRTLFTGTLSSFLFDGFPTQIVEVRAGSRACGSVRCL